jgi:hypothetical protein
MTAVKERPMIFSGPMIRALLQGRKTQTRRVAKLPEQPEHRGGWEATTIGGDGSFVIRSTGRVPVSECAAIWNRTTGMTIACPYDVGDRIWVRETFQLFDPDVDPIPPERFGARAPYSGCEGDREIRWTAVYRADGELSHPQHGAVRWRSPIHMPRWASRLQLEVTEVRAQRVQAITCEDAIAEGAFYTQYHSTKDGWSLVETTGSGQCLGSPQMAFANQWNVIHGGPNWNLKPGSPWDDNPLVWAVSFKRVEESR